MIHFNAEEWMNKVGAITGLHRHRAEPFTALIDYLERLGPSLDDAGLADMAAGERATPKAGKPNSPAS